MIKGYNDPYKRQKKKKKKIFKKKKNDWLVGLAIALRPQTPTHIRGGWSYYTDTSEPVDGGVGTLQL
jgi:N-acetylneuraminic acid mutarotase